MRTYYYVQYLFEMFDSLEDERRALEPYIEYREDTDTWYLEESLVEYDCKESIYIDNINSSIWSV